MSGHGNPSPRKRSWWVRSLLVTAAVSLGIQFLLRVLAFRAVPYVVVLGVCVAAVFSREFLRRVAEPDWLRARETVAPLRVRRRGQPGGWYEGGDGMVEAVRRWDRRLEWAARDGDRFAFTMGRQFGEVVDERLRQRCGISRASHPEEARTVLGERVWALLGPRAHPPSPREFMAALDDLERIPDNLGQLPPPPAPRDRGVGNVGRSPTTVPNPRSAAPEAGAAAGQARIATNDRKDAG